MPEEHVVPVGVEEHLDALPPEVDGMPVNLYYTDRYLIVNAGLQSILGVNEPARGDDGKIRGIKIDNVAALDATGLDRRRIAENSVRITLSEVFNPGFFHADPIQAISLSYQARLSG